MKGSFLVIIVTSFILSGCANSLLHTIDNSNKSFEENFSPYRYVEIEKENTYTKFELEPAGVPHQTIASASELLLIDIFKSFKEKCGFEKEDIIGIRKVSYEPPQYYEVWVFKDELSKRADKSSAISLVLKQYPNGDGVDISLFGQCHSVPKQITFAN